MNSKPLTGKYLWCKGGMARKFQYVWEVIEDPAIC